MLEMFDSHALRLQADAHRAQLAGTMRAARRAGLARSFGVWLVNVGERLAHDDQRLRPAADCG